MGKKHSGLYGFLGGIVIAAIVVSAIFAAPATQDALGWNDSDDTAPPAIVTDSSLINLSDGVAGHTLYERDFDADLYGLRTGRDPSIWSNWVRQTGVERLSDISLADLDDTEYSRWFVNYSATNYVDEILDTTRQFYARHAEIYKTVNNSLEAFETPNAGAAFAAFNSASGAYINLATTNITTAVNFTIIGMCNVTQSYARYQKYFNFYSYQDVRLSYYLGFNDTVTTVDMNGGGLTKSGAGTTGLEFFFDSLGAASPSVHQFTWSDAAIAAAALRVVGTTVAIRWNGVAI